MASSHNFERVYGPDFLKVMRQLHLITRTRAFQQSYKKMTGQSAG